VLQRVAVALVVDDLQLVAELRVTERGLEEEAVELRLRQRERALVLDRVLGREDDERLGQAPRLAVDRDLPFGHRLEQRRLRLRHRTVDLVDENDVGEDRPRPELEVARALVEHRQAGDVGRLQVGRALDPRREGTRDRLRDRPRQHGLRRSGHVLEQHVALADECGQHELDLLALAVDDVLDRPQEPRGDLGGTGERRRVGPRDPGLGHWRSVS
jgi:hypothetical protein